MRICKSCGKKKSKKEFYWSGQGKDHLESVCIQCYHLMNDLTTEEAIKVLKTHYGAKVITQARIDYIKKNWL